MEPIVFNGQQTDERILYELHPHPLAKNLAIGKLISITIFFFVIIQLIGNVYAPFGNFVRFGGTLLSVAILGIGIWWIATVYKKARTFITDRRIIRFEVSTPFVETKRALFWSEALKAKAYPPNIIYKMLRLGVVRVEPQMQEGENVIITDVYMYEDVANYIDKILFIFKNKPADIASLRPFVPKPRGQRD